MSGLSPVAWMASPRRVRRKTLRKQTTSAAAISPTKSLYRLDTAVPDSSFLSTLNTVSVLFILSSDAPPITAMLMEYSPVFTIMPASRLSMPSFVCSRAVTKPDSTPAHMAAGSDSQG